MPSTNNNTKKGLNIKQKAMIEALQSTLGIVTSACKIVGMDRTAHYKWLKENEEYKNAVEDIDNIAIDFAESKLHSNIKDGDTTSIIFFLKTKGKRRGYIERQDIDVTTNGENINQITIFELPDNGRDENK